MALLILYGRDLREKLSNWCWPRQPTSIALIGGNCFHISREEYSLRPTQSVDDQVFHIQFAIKGSQPFCSLILHHLCISTYWRDEFPTIPTWIPIQQERKSQAHRVRSAIMSGLCCTRPNLEQTWAQRTSWSNSDSTKRVSIPRSVSHCKAGSLLVASNKTIRKGARPRKEHPATCTYQKGECANAELSRLVLSVSWAAGEKWAAYRDATFWSCHLCRL